MNLRPAASRLRTDYFPTRKRAETNCINISYTGTIADPRVDAVALDMVDACKGYFGITYHYVILLNGDIEIGRDPQTTSSRGRLAEKRHDTIFIGVVGGLNMEDGRRIVTITDAQRLALSNLEQAIADVLQKPLDVIDHCVDWVKTAEADALLEEQEAAALAEMDSREANDIY